MRRPTMLTLFTICILSFLSFVQADITGESGLSRRARHHVLRAPADGPSASSHSTTATSTKTESSSSASVSSTSSSSTSPTSTSHTSHKSTSTPTNDDNGSSQVSSSSSSRSSSSSSSSSSTSQSQTVVVISNTNVLSPTQPSVDPVPGTTLLPSSDDPTSSTDTSIPTGTPADGVAANNNAFLANKSAVAAVSSIAAIAGAAALGFIVILTLRRRAKQRRQDKWRRSTWFTGNQPDQDFDGFEKVEPGGGVPMGEMHGNESRDYFAPGEYMFQQNQHSQEGQADLPPTGFDSPGRNTSRNPYWSSSPAIDYPPTAASRGQTYSGLGYPPGMTYSPEAHDAYDAAQQDKLNELHKYTLEPITPTSPIHPDDYQPSPLALSRHGQLHGH